MKHPELESEQEYLDVALEFRENGRHAWERENSAGANKDASAQLRKMGENVLKNFVPPSEPAALGRLDFITDEEPIYVGKQTIWNSEYDILVCDWRNPVSRPFFTNLTGDQGTLRRKRTFEIEDHKIVSIDDLVLSDIERQVRELEEGQTLTEGPGVDPLLNDLNRTRDGQMKDIVRTIQQAQFDLISASPRQVLIIQGGPGTGKTAIALHRASWLLFNDPDISPESLLIVGPNKTFVKYISDVLPTLGDSNVRQTDIASLGSGAISPSVLDPLPIQKLKGEMKMTAIIKRALNQRIRIPESEVVIQAENARISVQPSSVASRVEELGEVVYSRGRQLFKDWLRELSREKSSRGLFDALEAAIERTVESIWPQLTSRTFIYDLLSSPARLLDAAGKDLVAQEIRDIQRPSASRIAEQKWSVADLPLIDFADSLISEDAPRKYLHIVVDEAQDLSPMQLLMLKRRSSRNHMTLVGDIAQSTGPHSRDSWDDILTTLNGREGGQVQSLRFGYRVPSEVHEIAAQLLPHIASGIEGPTAIRRSNQEPEFVQVDKSNLLSSAVDHVKAHAGLGRSVGLIIPEEMVDEVANYLREKSINFADARSGQLGASINLIPSGIAKGLEFDSVVVVDPLVISGSGGRDGLRSLYIALTRTTKFLTVVYDKLPSELQVGIPESGPTIVGERTEKDSEKGISDGDFTDVQSRFVAVLADQVLAMLGNLQPGAQRDVLREVERRLPNIDG